MFATANDITRKYAIECCSVPQPTAIIFHHKTDINTYYTTLMPIIHIHMHNNIIPGSQQLCGIGLRKMKYENMLKILIEKVTNISLYYNPLYF